MEEKLLADVFDNDMHVRLDAGERLTDYFRKADSTPDAFPDLERLIGGLASWLNSSNFKMNMCAIDVLGTLVLKMGDKFKPHITTVLPGLREKLGDTKDQVRDQTQLLIQQIMQNVSGTAQMLLDRLLEVAFVHKNWRVKEQGLICLTRTLNYFGSGQVSVAKFIGHICALLGDANSQVRTCAVDTLVEIYHHVGVKVRIDLSKRNLPPQKLAMLNSKFDEIDGSHGNVTNEQEDDANSVSSSSSNLSSASAQAQTSAQLVGSSRSQGAQAIPRPSSVNRIAAVGAIASSGSGAVSESDFEKAFTDVPHINIFTQGDLEKAVGKVAEVMENTANSWDVRVNALKELRSIASYESLDTQVMVGLLKSLESPMLTSLKDLRSQVTREACVTISYLATVLGHSFSHFAEQMLPQLIALLPNSAKVMASSADVCVKFLLKHTHSHRLLQPIAFGLQSKSSITRKQCAECLYCALRCWETGVVEKCATLVEDCVGRTISDADATTRKHIRRAFWTYHKHLPSAGDRLLASFDPQIQKHLNDERVAMESHAPSGLPPPGSMSSISKLKRKLPVKSDADVSGSSEALQRTLTSIANVRPEAVFEPPVLAPTLSLPIIKVQQPTVRRKPRPLQQQGKMSQSVEDLTQGGPLPPSPQVIKRPQSRAIMTAERKNDLLPSKIATPPKRPKSTNPSPSVSRDSSPPRAAPRTSASLPRNATPLRMDDLERALEGEGRHNGGDQDEDDNGSVTSERSTFSITSEVSVSPYVKYSNPIEDLNELAALCSKTQWGERRDGVAQLHMLLESGKALSHNDMLKVKGIFRKMFSEPHTKVFGMFLDVLSRFIEEHKEYLDDFLFLMLLRLLHRQGTDMLSSVHYKLMAVLELIRKNFEPEQQFSTLGRILTDPQQPMNTKVKLAWLEYFLEVIAQMEPSDFKDDVETQQMVTRLVDMTSDPSSNELRRSAQRGVVGLFELNTSSYHMLICKLPQKNQVEADRIIKAHMEEGPGEEGESKPASNPKVTKVTSSPALKRSKSPSQSNILGTRAPIRAAPEAAPGPVPRPSSRNTNSLNPGSLMSSRAMCSSSPDLSTMGTSSTRSLIPVPSTTPVGSPNMSRIPMLRRPNSTTPSKSTTPQPLRKGTSPQKGGVRSVSVDPERMSERSQAPPPPRPSSVRSHSSLRMLRTAEMEDIKEGSSPSNSAASSQFSFSDLTKLDFGSPENGGPPPPGAAGGDRDEVDLIVSELTSAPSSKLRCLALQSLLTFCREYPNKCSWDKNLVPTVKALLGILDDEEPPTRTMGLRVIREMLKSQSSKMAEFSEPLTLKILLSFADNDTSVSQAAEDIFTLLAPAIPNESTLLLLIPMAAKEKYPMLLGVIKFLTKVVALSKDEFLSQHLAALVPSVVKGYCHSESSVRKTSVFCLVAIHAVVGEKIREYLSKLTSSQVKLLDLYIKRHQQGAAPIQ